MRTLVTLSLVAVCLSAAEPPNLSGRWRNGSDYIDIDHRDPVLIVQAGENARFLSVDGVERTDVTRTVAAWNGSAVEVRTLDPPGVERFELSPDGRHLEVVSGGKTRQFERADLRAGIASVDVTPTTLLSMYGYANRKCGLASGQHDPLRAKALVLESGPTRVALVTLDVGSFVSTRLVNELKQTLRLDAVLLAASHTHSAPQFLPRTSTPTSALGETSEGGAAYFAQLERNIVDLVRRASDSMFAARLHIGRGDVRLGYNRLVPREHGRSRALFDNLERLPLGPLDSEFQLLEVRDERGTPRALLVHYAVHPVVLGTTNCRYSADYPGAIASTIEQAVPGLQAMFVQGGAGDVNPIFQGRSGKEEEDFALVSRLGALLAAEALKSRSQLQPVPSPSVPIRTAKAMLTFDDRWEPGRTHDVGITTLTIGREIAIAALPGEPLHRLQRMWKERAEVQLPLFYGYTYSSGGEWPGYLPDIRSAAHGGYGADSTATQLEVGAGERIIDRHVIHLYGLLGMWRAKPGPS